MMMSDNIKLIGLDGANPLAFLAALGTLRKLTQAWPTKNVKMSWKTVDGSWRPVLYLSPEENEETIVQVLNDKLLEMKNHPAFQLGDNLNLSTDAYMVYAFKSAENFFVTRNRIWCDYSAAFGSESIHEDGVIKDTAFRTMQGAGHQHFIKFMRNIIEETNTEHIQKTLFESWKYDDPVPNLTLRFDPKDDSRYALQ